MRQMWSEEIPNQAINKRLQDDNNSNNNNNMLDVHSECMTIH